MKFYLATTGDPIAGAAVERSLAKVLRVLGIEVANFDSVSFSLLHDEMFVIDRAVIFHTEPPASPLRTVPILAVKPADPPTIRCLQIVPTGRERLLLDQVVGGPTSTAAPLLDLWMSLEHYLPKLGEGSSDQVRSATWKGHKEHLLVFLLVRDVITGRREAPRWWSSLCNARTIYFPQEVDRLWKHLLQDPIVSDLIKT